MKTPSPQSPPDANRLAAAPEARSPARPSLDKGDIPTQVLDRYLIERDRQGRPERFYRDNRTTTPMFRDHGRSLSTSLSYPDAVADMIKVARHRGWNQIRVAGDEGFRREVWVQANALGMDVKGYRPTERDRQAGARRDEPAPPGGRRSGLARPEQPSLKRRMDMAGVVVRALIADPVAQARLLDRAMARMKPLIDREDREQRDVQRRRER